MIELIGYREIAITQDGRQVGHADLVVLNDLRIGRIWGLVENVFVEPDCRRNSIGKEIMKQVEQEAKNCGCIGIKMMSGYERLAGHALYKSLDYIEGFSFSRWF